MQHETVIHYLKPMKNYLESLRSSKIVPLIENLITGKDISIENAQHIEVLLDDYYENDEVIQDFITDLALYNPGGGEYLYSHSEITPKAKHILAYIQKIIVVMVRLYFHVSGNAIPNRYFPHYCQVSRIHFVVFVQKKGCRNKHRPLWGDK